MNSKSNEPNTTLWSCINTSYGEQCPLYEHCDSRLRGNWCPDDDKLRLAQLMESRRVRLGDYDLIKHVNCGGVIELVEEIALNCLEEGGLRSPPVPTELFPDILGESSVEIRPLPLKKRHGATWYLPDGIVVQIKADDTPAQKRITLFHEAFHILSHTKASPRFRRRRPRRGSFDELLANHFTLCILMPKKWMEEKWREVQNVRTMAKIFRVPQQMMLIRLRFLGLI